AVAGHLPDRRRRRCRLGAVGEEVLADQVQRPVVLARARSRPRAGRRGRRGGQPVSSDTPILTAGPEEAPFLAGLVAAAFHHLAAAVWQIGDEELRRAVFPGYFLGYVAQAIEHGVVEVTEDRSAAALWVVEDGG